ncbi:nucleotide exchange factor GrpE [bacterium]|nr:nucleotide exchange factor GrpE [bacterium]
MKTEDEKEIEYIEDEKEKALNFEKKIKKLKEKLKVCQKEKEEYLAGWQRERADFVNYRQKEEERMKEKEQFLKEKIILEILPVLDNLEKAEKELPEDLKEHSWAKGILEIKNQMESILKKEGVKEIEKREKFDPAFHEAVKVVEGEENKIIEILQKGYLLNGRVIRPARVKVGKGKSLD